MSTSVSSNLTAPQCLVLIDRLHKCYTKYLSGLINQAIDSTTTAEDKEIPDYPPPPYSPPPGGEMAGRRGLGSGPGRYASIGSNNSTNNPNPPLESRTQGSGCHPGPRSTMNQPASASQPNVGDSHSARSTTAPNPPMNPTQGHYSRYAPAGLPNLGSSVPGWSGTPTSDGCISPQDTSSLREGIILDQSTWQHARDMLDIHTDYALAHPRSTIRITYQMYSEPDPWNQDNGSRPPAFAAPQYADGHQEFNSNQTSANYSRPSYNHQGFDGRSRSQSLGPGGLVGHPQPNAFVAPQSRPQSFYPPGPSPLRAAQSFPFAPVQYNVSAVSPWQSQSHAPGIRYYSQASPAHNSRAPDIPVSGPGPPSAYAPIQARDASQQAQAGSSPATAPQTALPCSRPDALPRLNTAHQSAVHSPLQSGVNTSSSSAISPGDEEQRLTSGQQLRDGVVASAKNPAKQAENEKIKGSGKVFPPKPITSVEGSGVTAQSSEPKIGRGQTQARETATKAATSSPFPFSNPSLDNHPDPVLSDSAIGSKRKVTQTSIDVTSPADATAGHSSRSPSIAQTRDNWGTAAMSRTHRASKFQKTGNETEAQKIAEAAKNELQNAEKRRMKLAEDAEKKQRVAKDLAAQRLAYAQGRRNGE